MGGPGGFRKNAGRKKGSKNALTREVSRVTREHIEQAAASGELPHEFLLRIARGEEINGQLPTLELRVDAAKAAAPYFAPRLAQIEQRIEAEVIGVVSAEPLTIEAFNERYQLPDGVATAAGTAENPD